MKTRNVKIAAAIAASSLTLATAIAHAGVAEAPARVTLVQPVSVGSTQGLVFDGVISTAAKYTVSIDPEGNVINEGPALLGEATQAVFNATGEPHYAVSVRIPSDITLTGVTSGETLKLEKLSHNAGTSPAFDANGIMSFGVGASLEVGENLQSDVYKGTVTVSVDY